MAKSLTVMVSVVVCAGCGTKQPPAELTEARRLLQLDRVQQALDVLAALPDDPTPEGHYLKAVALDRLQMQEAAVEEIETAVKQQPKNIKYQGLKLRFRLYDGLDQGHLQGADELIEMYQEHPSSASAAMFAFYAHQAQRMQLTAQSQADAAQKAHQDSLQALKTAIALSSAIPEFQREMLSFALIFELGDSAQIVADKLIAEAPNDLDLLQDQVRVLLLTRQGVKASAKASELYQRKHRTEQAAEIFAAALAATGPDATRDQQFRELSERFPQNENILQQYLAFLVRGGATSQRDRDFQSLVDRHPVNVEILTQHAIYLGRSGRVPAAVENLEQRARTQKDLALRWKLINVALSLAIESRDAQLARRLLDRYAAEVPHPVTRTYLDGRILYLQREYKLAEQRMLEIVEVGKEDLPAYKTMAAEALRWIELIRRERKAAGVLEQAAGQIRKEQDETLPQEPLSPQDAAAPAR